MSTKPNDKRRARRKIERPWYLRPITFKVIALLGRALAWIYDHI